MKNVSGKILLIGAGGQVGTELTQALREKFGNPKVIASDVRSVPMLEKTGSFIILDVLDKEALDNAIQSNGVSQIYLLAAVLSATGEKNPQFAWKLNMEGLLNVLDLSVKHKLDRVFWPSSIAVFGPSTPAIMTPQDTVMAPNTVYGISKLAGERWCEYYHTKFGLDVRSIRYPGLIGYKSAPGGGTTDYAVEIFHEALKKGSYTSFLQPGSTLPMMYMPDAIRATLELMDADAETIRVRSSYNLAGCSFAPEEIAAEIEKSTPGFQISYAPDFRQKIADSWPKSIDDSQARKDWAWKPDFDLKAMVEDMLVNIRLQYNGEPV